MPIVKVAIGVPADTLFDYEAADASARDIGCRVVVPFGHRTVVGVIIDVQPDTKVPRKSLRRPLRILREAALAPSDLELLRFAAEYYRHPIGAVVMDAVPAALRRVAARSRPHRTRRRRYVLTAQGRRDALASQKPRARARRLLLEQLTKGPLDGETASRLVRRAAAHLEEFIERGWVEAEAACVDSVPTFMSQHASPELSEEQGAAVAQIASATAYEAFLLFGVTGSGKTEVYLHAIGAALQRGRQALLLVPEIALTPQLEELVRRRFPRDRVASLHSGLTESQRLEHWIEAADGRARIVLGTRLAVFASMPAIGLIVVDEEQDTSFKQSEGFRYSARDLAVIRARQAAIPVVLGTATPALESYHNALSGRYRLLTLSSRIGGPPPSIRCLDTRSERLDGGLSPRLLAALQERLRAGEQSLVFINRRGYAPVLMCRSCSWISDCHRCAARLVLHLRSRELRCHHCGHATRTPLACPGCGNADLAPVGQGTQRVEETLTRHFPGARILRIDRDTTRGRQAWPAMRERIKEGKIDILVGTQMLAKGHDFPALNLVGVINADSRLYSGDFRAAERLYAMLTQVAGRAGRRGTPGEVLVQTEFPRHPLYEALSRQNYRAFADTALAERRDAGFPPYVHQALLRAEARQLSTALQFLEEAARMGRAIDADVTLYDPVPAGMPRRAGRERAQLLVQSSSRPRLRAFLGPWYRALSASASTPVRWSLDVDPIEF